MDATVDRHTTAPEVLAKWYAAHSAIRSLRAVVSNDEITVFISLEPTSDGDDALPVWLANHHRWVSDLSAQIRREVRLELNVSATIAEDDMSTDATVISELTWRDSWGLA